MPEQEGFSPGEARLVRGGTVRIPDHILYAVDYSGFFQSRFFLLLGRGSFLFENKQEVLGLIRQRLAAGLAHLYRVNFRELAFEINGPLDEFEEPSESLYLEYAPGGRPVSFLMPLEFLKSFLISFFRLGEIKKHSGFQELLCLLRARLYQDSLSSFWDIKNFFSALEDREIQDIFHLLLKGGRIEETMLTGFIAFFQGTPVMDRLMKNISRNMREDVIRNSPGLMRDRRWTGECVYLVRLALEEMLFTNQIRLPRLDFWAELRGRIKEERFGKIFRKKSYPLWLEEGREKRVLDRLRLKTDIKTILRSLAGLDERYLAFFTRNISSQALAAVREDFRYYTGISSRQEAQSARVRIVEILKDIYYEEKAQNILFFQNVLLDLDTGRLGQVIELAGIIRFSQALAGEGKEFKKGILASLSGVAKDLLADIISGKVRFKQAFGEQTVKAAKKEVLKICYFLKDDAF